MTTSVNRHVVSPPAALEVQSWGWRYATRRRWALRDVSLNIAPGERVLLMGVGSGLNTAMMELAW